MSVLYPPPHIPPGSRWSGRNPGGFKQIPSGMVGIWEESRWNGRNGRNLAGLTYHWESTQISLGLRIIPTNSTWILINPIKFLVEPFLPHNSWINPHRFTWSLQNSHHIWGLYSPPHNPYGLCQISPHLAGSAVECSGIQWNPYGLHMKYWVHWTLTLNVTNVTDKIS
jgi:hypothetical protein